MKNIQIILLFLLSFSLNAQQKLILNLSDFNIQGKVKSFTLKTKNYQNPNKIGKEVNTIYVQMDPDFISEFYFNPQGFLYESKSQEHKNTWKKYEFVGTEKNPLVSKISAQTIKENKDSNQEIYTISAVYQDQSYLVTTLFEDGKKKSVRRYLDSKGNVIKEHLEPIGKKVLTYTYDEKNNMIEINKNQEFYLKNIYLYDKEGKIIQKSEVHKNGLTHTFTYDNGLLTSITKPEGDVQNFTYEFDKNGNWIKRAYKINGVLVSEDFREYVYAENNF